MALAVHVILLLHLIGFAALFGGLLVQLRSSEPDVNPAMLNGSYIALITGVVLAAFVEVAPAGFGQEPVNEVKLVVKLLIALIVTVLVTVNRRFSSIPRGLWAVLGCLTLADVAVAVIWQ
jgi:hypothetical protein